MIPRSRAPGRRLPKETPSKVYQLKVTLLAVEPTVWRRILVPGDTTLDRLNTCHPEGGPMRCRSRASRFQRRSCAIPSASPASVAAHPRTAAAPAVTRSFSKRSEIRTIPSTTKCSNGLGGHSTLTHSTWLPSTGTGPALVPLDDTALLSPGRRVCLTGFESLLAKAQKL